MAIFRNLVGNVATPMFCEIVLHGEVTTTSGQVKPVLNVFHFRRLVVGGTPDLTTLGNNFNASVGDALRACLNARYTLVEILLRLMDDPANAPFSVPINDAGALGDAASAYDLLSAVYYLIHTGFRGRSFKGSKHFSGLDESQITGDELTAAAITATWDQLTTNLNSLIAGIGDGANTWFPCIISQELSSLGPTDIPGIFTGADWSEVLLNSTIGTMRRRKERSVYD